MIFWYIIYNFVTFYFLNLFRLLLCTSFPQILKYHPSLAIKKDLSLSLGLFYASLKVCKVCRLFGNDILCFCGDNFILYLTISICHFILCTEQECADFILIDDNERDGGHNRYDKCDDCHDSFPIFHEKSPLT